MKVGIKVVPRDFVLFRMKSLFLYVRLSLIQSLGGNMEKLQQRGLFNENGDIELSKRRMINGNTTNLNDFNNIF